MTDRPLEQFAHLWSQQQQKMTWGFLLTFRLCLLIECWRFGVRDSVLRVPYTVHVYYYWPCSIRALLAATGDTNLTSVGASVPLHPPLPLTYCSLTPFPRRFTQVYSITSTSDNWTHWQNPYTNTNTLLIKSRYYVHYIIIIVSSTDLHHLLQDYSWHRGTLLSFRMWCQLWWYIPRQRDISPFVDPNSLI